MIKFVTNMLVGTPLQYFEGENGIDLDIVKQYKIKLFSRFLDTPHMRDPATITFDLETPYGELLDACVEKYRCSDGKYWVEGRSIEREELEKRLSNVKCILVMKVSDSIKGVKYVS